MRIGDPGPKGRILVRGEYGHDIVDELAPADGEVVIDKPGKGAFYATDLELDAARRRASPACIVTGVTTEVCVHTTVREANDRGYECLVLADCVGSYFPEFQRVGLAHDRRPGRDLRLGRLLAAVCSRPVDRPASTSRPRPWTTSTATRHQPHPPSSRLSKLPLWTRGDTNAFFGLGFNVLVNVLVLTGLCLGVVHIPDHDVLRRHPARAGHPAADRQRLLHLPGAPAGSPRGPRPTSPRCPTGPACRTCSS